MVFSQRCFPFRTTLLFSITDIFQCSFCVSNLIQTFQTDLVEYSTQSSLVIHNYFSIECPLFCHSLSNQLIISVYHTSLSYQFIRPVYQASLSGQFIIPVYQTSLSGQFIRPLYQATASDQFIRPLYHITLSGHLIIPSLSVSIILFHI